MPIEIRRAVPADADRMLPLIRDHARFERSTATCDAADLSEALTGEPPRLFAWVAEDEHGIAGYASGTLDFATWMCRSWFHLDCLFVVEGQRGAKVGSRLLTAARRFARAAGATELQWQTPDWNERAIVFYQREGASSQSKVRFKLEV